MKQYYTKLIFILTLVIVTSVTLALNFGYAQTNQCSPQLPILTSFGNAEVRVRPDVVEVKLGVETQADTATEARQQNAVRATKIVDALRQIGIPETAISTSLFDIQPIRRFDNPNDKGEPPIVGYSAVNIITVRSTQLDLAPRIIDESVKAGANRVESVDFTLANDASARQKALRQAVADARTNARTMATELGVMLSAVQSVQQGGFNVGQPPVFYRAAEQSSASTPILPGEVTITASVTVIYRIR